MKVIVTGCSGFIGSHLTDRLLNLGYFVIGIDNLSTGKKEFLLKNLNNINFKFYNYDITNLNLIKKIFEGVDIVFHLSANADVRNGLTNTYKDLEQNTIATYNILESMRINKVKHIIFSSTGSVYGEANQIPTPEDTYFPIQTSLYGASKISCEALISAYVEGFGITACIFRFVSILGERYTHGHVFDFYKQLKIHPNSLNILGDGTQKKSYLYISDCIDAIVFSLSFTNKKIEIYNLGTNEYCDVNQSVNWICREMCLTPELSYSGGMKGWVGDNPFIFLDTTRIRNIGWEPKYSIENAVIKTVKYLKQNEWLLNQ